MSPSVAATTIDPAHHHTIERLATLDERVNGLEDGIKDIAAAVRSLATDVKNGQSTPWGIILTGAGVALSFVVAIGGLAYMPMREQIVELKTEIRALDKEIVPRVEHERIWGLQQRLAEVQQKRVDRLEDDFYRRTKATNDANR